MTLTARDSRVLKSLRVPCLFAGAVLVGAAVMAARPPAPVDVVKEPTTMPPQSRDNKPASPLDFSVKNIDGADQKLADYKGKVVMIVNVASKCGFTPQYEGLQRVYEKYEGQGFVVLAFPANNFKAQEPGTNEEIKEFCSSKFHVTFPMMSKISVLGEDKAPLYKFLTEKETGRDFAGEIGWNFTKFLVDRNGNVFARFPSQTKPEDPKVTEAIEKALKAQAAEK